MCSISRRRCSALRASFEVAARGKSAPLKNFRSVYVSGWQCAADANTAGNTFPDQSIYPANAMPELVRRINNSLRRQDLIDTMEGKVRTATWHCCD